MLVGDPHPENLYTALASGSTLADSPPQLALEWIDLDSVTSGAFHLDLRRATMGLTSFFGGTTECDEDCVRSISEAVLQSYRDAVFQAERNRPVLAPPLGEIWSNLAREARNEGAERKKFNKYSRQINGSFTLDVDNALADSHKGALATHICRAGSGR